MSLNEFLNTYNDIRKRVFDFLEFDDLRRLMSLPSNDRGKVKQYLDFYYCMNCLKYCRGIKDNICNVCLVDNHFLHSHYLVSIVNGAFVCDFCQRRRMYKDINLSVGPGTENLEIRCQEQCIYSCSRCTFRTVDKSVMNHIHFDYGHGHGHSQFACGKCIRGKDKEFILPIPCQIKYSA